MKIVGAAVAFGLTLALVIGNKVDPPQHLLEALGHYVSTMLSALAGVFAWLTIVFALLEHYGVKTSDLAKEKQWRPADLPQVPAKAALIRPLEPILGIVFTVLFIILLNADSQLIGIYSVGEDVVTVTPLLNREVFKLYLPYFNVLLILVIVKEALKLVAGKWTLALAGLNSVLNVFSLVLVITVFLNPENLYAIMCNS
jgi:hypothetical protein